MITAYQTYGALGAKARALYAKRPDTGTLRAVSQLKSAADIVDAIRALPGWQGAVAALSPDAGYDGLVRALDGRLAADYGALLHYMPQKDRALADFPTLLAEQACLLDALRFVRRGLPVDGGALPSLPHSSRLLPAALHGCTGVDGIAAAAARTIFAAPLRRMARLSSVSDEISAESALQGAYFAAIFTRIDKDYCGKTRTQLRHIFGSQLDLFNLMLILRLKPFSADGTRILSTLLPRRYLLRAETLHALVAAPDTAALLPLLRGTPYAAYFSGVQATEAEDACRRACYALHRAQLQRKPPSICTLVSYYYLIRLEIEALVTAVESARYGAVLDDIFSGIRKE